MLDTSSTQKPIIPSVASMKKPSRNESMSASRKAAIVAASGGGGK
jgi:hypothetical protein